MNCYLNVLTSLHDFTAVLLASLSTAWYSTSTSSLSHATFESEEPTVEAIRRSAQRTTQTRSHTHQAELGAILHLPTYVQAYPY
jgi:hypothetical protein